jgi:hypothetical protein
MVQVALSKKHAESVTAPSVLADGSQCFRTSKFTQVVTRLAPGCVLVTGIGYNDGKANWFFLSAMMALGSNPNANASRGNFARPRSLQSTEPCPASKRSSDWAPTTDVPRS